MRSWIFILFYLPLCLLAQTETKPAPKKVIDYMYKHEFSGGLKIQTNGVSLYLTKGWIKNIYVTNLVQLEYQYFFNYKDKLNATNPAFGQKGKKYYYGLQNRFHAIRASYGLERMIADKSDRNGVRLSFIGFLGFSLGLQKPYYLELLTGRDTITGEFLHESVKYSNSTDSKFMNKDSIYEASPFYKGIGQMIPVFGGHIKAGLNFDWGSKDRFVKALEVGVMLDIYYKKVPIYVNKDANSFLHPALYLGFHFGKRW